MADGHAPQALAAECELFCRYLSAGAPTPYVLGKYAAACELRGTRAGSGELDRRLLAFARRGPTATRIADVFARFLAPRSDLRRRLVLLLAILESTPAAEELDRIEPTPPRAVVLGLVPRLLGSALCLALGLLLLGPLLLVHGRGAAGRAGGGAAGGGA